MDFPDVNGQLAPINDEPDSLSSILGKLTPAELAQLLSMGTLDERQGLAQQQMARADALRNYEAPNMGTPGGAIGAGLGDLFREIGGGIGGLRAQSQIEGLLGKKDAGRSLYADLLRRLGMQQAPPEKVVDLSGMTGY